MAQAELDHHVRDTYNYVTVQADIAMPGRQLAVLEDTYRQASHRLLLYYDVACLCFNSAHVTVHSVKAVGCMHCESSLSTVLQPDCGDSRNSSTVSISIICNLAHKKKGDNSGDAYAAPALWANGSDMSVC